MAKPDLMERVDILVGQHGKKWKEIISILEKEGYVQSGQPLGTNTIRKRYDRWLKATKKMGPPSLELKGHPETVTPAKTQPPPSSKADDKSDMMVSAKEVLELLKGSIERRDSMLASQIQKEQEKAYDGLLEQRLETRLTEKLSSKINEAVQNVAAAALRKLQDEETAFRQELYDTVEEIVLGKMTDHLASLLAGIEIKEKTAGPGRGHKGSSATKFSATMRTEVYDEMKSLGGIFSSHLAAACELYLKVRQKHPTR